MKLINSNAELFVPDNTNTQEALNRTTSLCIAAHHDDIEIMAFSGIVDCFSKKDKWFTGVVVTDGAGSPRSGVYADFTDEEMKAVRAKEQKNAAVIGDYSAQFLLAHKSSDVKDKNNKDIVNELAELILACSPEVLYTHNLADKHDTHVAVVLKVIQALRTIPKEKRPKKIYTMEVWRGLDWLCDEDKSVFNTASHENLAAALLGVFDSQIAGGKRYDLAAMGRRLANATFFASHNVDDFNGASYGLDITEFVNDETLSPSNFINIYIDRFKQDVVEKINKYI